MGHDGASASDTGGFNSVLQAMSAMERRILDQTTVMIHDMEDHGVVTQHRLASNFSDLVGSPGSLEIRMSNVEREQVAHMRSMQLIAT